jgi:hypothetical protein
MNDKAAPVPHELWERHRPQVTIKLFAHVAIDGRSVATITTSDNNRWPNDHYYDVCLEMLAGEVSPTELYTLATLEQRARRKLHAFELDLAKPRRAV